MAEQIDQLVLAAKQPKLNLDYENVDNSIKTMDASNNKNKDNVNNIAAAKKEKQPIDEDTNATTAVTEFNPELEPLLRDNPRRFVIFPIQYPDIWDMYKKVMKKNFYYDLSFFID